MTSRAKQIAIGAGLGLLAGLAGAFVCSASFAALYHPHGGGDIGDWTSLGVAMAAFVGGVPLGIAAGIGWSFSPWRRRFLFAALCGVGALAAAVELVVTRR